MSRNDQQMQTKHFLTDWDWELFFSLQSPEDVYLMNGV